MDIAREEVTDGVMNSEGVSQTGRGNDGRWKARKTKNRFPLPFPRPWKLQKARFPHSHRRDDDTVISPFKPKEKSAAHFPAPSGLACNENALPYRATPQEPYVPRCAPLDHSKQRGCNIAGKAQAWCLE